MGAVGALFAAALIGPGAWGTLLAVTGAFASAPVASVVGAPPAFGTFTRRRDAQRAIEEAYGLPAEPRSLGDYFGTWLEQRPRAERTNATYSQRINPVLAVEIEGRVLRDWPLAQLRRFFCANAREHQAQAVCREGFAVIER